MRRRLSGWGRTPAVDTDVVDWDPERLPDLFSSRPARGVLARGLGRSYGDAAQNAGGTTLAAGATTGIVCTDLADGCIKVDGAMSLAELMAWAVPRGWFVPVVPGTRHVTVGGAVAADVHGKNHHRDGSFCAHVERLWLHAPAEGVVELRPHDELFRATVGGLGLTGVILGAELRLLPIDTAAMTVHTRQVADLDDALAALTSLDAVHRYTVAWLDLLGPARSVGRGVVSGADHATLARLDERWKGDPLRFAPGRAITVPDLVPKGLVSRPGMAIANELWYRRARRPRDEVASMPSFLHPLDGIDRWNRLYGRRGFVQHQFVVPDSADEALRRVVAAVHRERLPLFLAVLKRFGPQGEGLLSFPVAGWTLALDLPADRRVAPTLDRIDDLVVEAGGRIYLAKDARMNRRHLEPMYPALRRWRVVRDRADPDGVLVSDLDRRLNLSGRHR